MQKKTHCLIIQSEIQEGLKLNGYFGRALAFILMRFLRLRTLNKAYSNLYHEDCETFVGNCIKARNNKLVIAERDLENIPKEGPVVFLFNHPYGGLDALVIIQALLKVRPDTKFIGNYLLGRAEPIAPLLFKVNPFETHKGAFSSFSGLKKMIQHIQDGNCVCILPAGKVSTAYGKSKVIEDREWQPNIMKYILISGAPVVSGYVTGVNSKLFYLLDKIHPLLRTASLPHELINKKNLTVHMRFSGVSSPEFLKSVNDNEKLADILRAKTYCLEEDCYDQNIRSNKQKEYQKLLDPINETILHNEIEKLNPENLLFATDNYFCFYSFYEEIPNVFKEISRLRELTNREIGLGTGKSSDYDDFDYTHKHLFIWDKSTSTIIAACRIGVGENLVHSGTGNWSNINSDFKSYLDRSIEIGKIFVRPENKNSESASLIIKKAILSITQEHQTCKYLVASAGISNLYSKHSKILILEYLKRKHRWPESLLTQTNSTLDYSVSKHHEILLEALAVEINEFDRLIKDIDTNKFGIPLLIKTILFNGGKIVDFKPDDNSPSSINCLAIIDLDKLHEEYNQN